MDILEKISSYRKENKAPVDSYGCSALNKNTPDERQRRFGVLVTVLISSRTKDAQTAKAWSLLDKNKLLSVPAVLKSTEDKIRKCLFGVGFHKTKSRNIKKIAEALSHEHSGDIPDSISDLLKLPGVGIKTALLVMQHGWNRCVGISVDVHLHRVFNRIGVVSTGKPEETQSKLEDIYPENKWGTVNETVVGFGQICCLPTKPRCTDCPIKDVCCYKKQQ
ncbi:MAG: endonuclease III [Amphiamblys sp. WSBS2006]|nr:MAG: endonuclease III [Amphiamblys sp. WSBS2006]